MGFAINAALEKNMDGRTLLHRFRYHLGSGFVTPEDTVLDVACGTGYGSDIIAQKAKKVIGIDKEKSNIYDPDHKHEKNIEFICADLETYDLPPCDVACSFESIEHLYKPYDFIQKLKKATKKYIITSVPVGCEKLIVVNGDVQADLDSEHHSVFSTPNELDVMFVDQIWQQMIGFRLGVTYIAVYYNNEGII